MIPRFRILQRDGFRCVYCGATPDVAELHVDHYQPKSRGGTDHQSNLRTACRACNLSKSDSPPTWNACSPVIDGEGFPADVGIFDFEWPRPILGFAFCAAWSDLGPSRNGSEAPTSRCVCL